MKKSSKAVSVLVAGTLINMSIGFLYAWSVFKNAMVLPIEQGGWAWTHSEANAAYTTAIVVWSIGLLIGGLIQDKIGPKKVIQIGVALVGGGLLASSFSQNPIVMTITVGVIVATGIGFVYGPITPMCMKWFHSSKKGMVSGITVAGFGVAAMFLAPLASVLLGIFGISKTFLIFGVGVLTIAVPLTLIVGNPPEGYVPTAPKGSSDQKKTTVNSSYNFNWKEMVKTPAFYMVWVMFVLSSSAGVMMIGHLASIATKQAGIAQAAYLVALLSFSNASGRVGGGILSDKIGRLNTMMLVFTTQLLNMVFFNFYNTEVLIIIGTIVAGFSYGSLMSTFPSLTADKWGLKFYGGNYGVMYMAWGVSGIVGPLIAGWAIDTTGTYSLAYSISAILLGVAIALAIGLRFTKVKPPRESISDLSPEMA